MGNACNCNNGDQNLHNLQPEQDGGKVTQDGGSALNNGVANPIGGAGLSNRQCPMNQPPLGSNRSQKGALQVNVSNTQNESAQVVGGLEQKMKDARRAQETSAAAPNQPSQQQVGQGEGGAQGQPRVFGMMQQQPEAVVAAAGQPTFDQQQQQQMQLLLQQNPAAYYQQYPLTPAMLQGLTPEQQQIIIQQQLIAQQMLQQQMAVVVQPQIVVDDKAMQNMGNQTALKNEEQKKNPLNDISNNPASPSGCLVGAGSGTGFRVASNLTNGSLFEKIGGDDGIKQLIDKMYAKIVEDPLLAPFFARPGLDTSMLKDKFRFFFVHMTGGADNWIGKPLEDVHRYMGIEDAHFDAFNSHCIQTLKEMRRLKVDGLKEMIRLLQGLRDKIVSKDEPGADPNNQGPNMRPSDFLNSVQPKNLFEEMGGMEPMKAVVFSLINLTKADPQLGPFFQYTEPQLYLRRLAHFFAHLGGASEEWIGKPIDEAHRGRFIKHEHFDLFVGYTAQALKLNLIAEIPSQKFIDILKQTRSLIVFEEELEFNMWQKLNYKNKFEGLVGTFVEKLAKDPLFASYFSQNIMMKHMIHSIVTAFFAQTSIDEGATAPILQTYGLILTQEQFVKSQLLFKEACHYHKVNPLVIKEAMNEYTKLEKHLVKNELQAAADDKAPEQPVQQQPVVLNNRQMPPPPVIILPAPSKESVSQGGESGGNEKGSMVIASPKDTLQDMNHEASPQQQSQSQPVEVAPKEVEVLKAPSKESIKQVQVFEEEKKAEQVTEVVAVEAPKEEVQMVKEPTAPIEVKEEVKIEEVQKQETQPEPIQVVVAPDEPPKLEEKQKTEEIKAVSPKSSSHNEQPQVEAQEAQDEANADQESVRGPAEDIRQIEKPQMGEKIDGIECKYESMSIKASEEDRKEQEEPVQRQLTQQRSIVVEEPVQAISEPTYVEQPEVHVAQVVQPVVQVIPPQAVDQSRQQIVSQLEQLMEESSVQESKISPSKRSVSRSPSKGRKLEVELKYNFFTLLNTPTASEGELSRNVERQKIKIQRWLVLKKEALFIYKDKINAKSFPEKPLQCVPLAEIESVRIKSPTAEQLKKLKTPAMFELEITLKDQYVIIASKIGQLFTDYTLAVLGNTLQNPNESRMNVSMISKLPYHPSKLQVHGFTDTALVFLSANKKDIQTWHKKITTKIELIKNQQDRTQLQMMENNIMQNMNEITPGFNLELIPNLSERSPAKLFNFAHEFLPSVQEKLQEETFERLPTEHIPIICQSILILIEGDPANRDLVTVNLDELKKSDLTKVLVSIQEVIKDGGIVLNQVQEQTLQSLLEKYMSIAEDPIVPPELEHPVSEPAREPASLFERIGGAMAINALVEGMYAKIFYDPDLSDFFRKTEKEHQKEMQRRFLTFATGGSKDWEGKAMDRAHEGRGITTKEFDRVAFHVVTTLQELKVSQPMINEVVGLLLPLRNQIADDLKSNSVASPASRVAVSKQTEQASSQSQIESKPSLYDRLGGAEAIHLVVEGMYSRIFVDEDLGDFFKKTDKEHLKKMQKEFLSYATGGPVTYTGRTMPDSHHGRGIGEKEYNKTVQIIVETMKGLGVSDDLIAECATLILPLKPQIADSQ